MNTQSNHTSKSWKLVKREHGNINIEISDGCIRSVVARIYDNELAENHGSYEYNARLIVSCPELLEALKWVVEDLSEFDEYEFESLALAKNLLSRLNL